MGIAAKATYREPWNKVKIVGRVRELALFNPGIDSKLRGRDLVALKVRDVCHGDQVGSRSYVRSVGIPTTAAAIEHKPLWPVTSCPAR
jgi:hypothetical protein